MFYKLKYFNFYDKKFNMFQNMSLLRSSKIHRGLYIFYRHIMPNGIFQTNNAVRHGMLVAYN